MKKFRRATGTIITMMVFLIVSTEMHAEQLVQSSESSANLSIQLVWQDKSITGFPKQIHLVPSDSTNDKIVAAVDTSGNAQAYLSPGKYRVSPEINYHWMGETFIRIDDVSSFAEIDVKSESHNDTIQLALHTLEWPSTQNEQGILLSSQNIDSAQIDDFIKARMAFFEVPGASVTVFKDNKIIYDQQYGVAHVSEKDPITSDTLFEAGSITKLVFAFAVMRLYERDVINLDKPLMEYLPHPEINDDRYLQLTARHVLSHQSGMANWPRKDENGQFALNFAPGTAYGYSGKAFEYLKDVLVHITSLPIETLLENEVLKPLGLDDMHFRGNDEIAARGAHGHKRNQPSEIYLPKKTMVAFTLQTTSQSLAKFAMALHQRKGLKPSTYEEFFTSFSTRDDGTHWGLGTRIENTTQGVTYGHSGSTGRGFISNLVLYDEHGLGYVILTNSQMGGWLSIPLLNEFLVLGNLNPFQNG